jgi:hypothetical protein
VADAHVYHSAGEAPETGSNAVSAAGREAPRSALCSAAAKLLSEAESGANTPRACESDEDCSRALFTPACNRASGLCVPCPRPDQIASTSVRAGLCIGANAERCCRGETSIADCLLEACASRCDAD